jgi:hypothetical protein
MYVPTKLAPFPQRNPNPPQSTPETIKTQNISSSVLSVQNSGTSSEGSAKMFIYLHESGNNPSSVNTSSGACGLGQALPCSKLPCSLTDYVCQDNWFTNDYMIPRYHTWENAEEHWLEFGWW